jgi:archaemetzincin
MKKIIQLLKIGQIDESILVDLSKGLELQFKDLNIFTSIHSDIIPLEKSDYNKKRSQYNGLKLLRKIELFLDKKPSFRGLGLTQQDIYSKSLKFIFGRASFPNNEEPFYPVGAVISTKRLRESFYRRSEDPGLFQERTLKEAVHELGHTFSLPHCSKFCIMRFSNSLYDTDNKPISFCKSCLEKLRTFFKNLEDSF